MDENLALAMSKGGEGKRFASAASAVVKDNISWLKIKTKCLLTLQSTLRATN